jgi:redox-sensitive bicupin YhaK (pirin superfamily)
MITVRKAADRGQFNHGWLDTSHTFSFADYHDPKFMGFRTLRVINEDRVQAGEGFGTHGHRDMEILSYVLEGALAHRDSMGTGATVVPGELQRMSAGTGVRHSEFNAAPDASTHFLQIWILPSQQGIDPGYEQKAFADADKRGRLRVVASPDGRDGSLTVHADASLYAGLFDGDERAELSLAPGRLGYVHVARGALRVNGQALAAGDAALLRGESQVELGQGRNADVLVFDLAP